MKKIIKLLASVKITTACLLLLFILTFWGTVAQVDHGLYAAQERYFFSLFFKIGNVVPFPGAQGVLWVLFVNLCAGIYTHFSRLKTWRSAGLKLTHLGVLIYFVAAFVTFQLTEESNVHLMEGEATNVGSSYSEWEIAFWKEQGPEKHVTAYDLTHVTPGKSFDMDGVAIYVEQFYLHCNAYTTRQEDLKVLNASEIDLLEPLTLNNERERNIAGGIFKINGTRVLLFGNESKPTQLGDKYFMLRHKKVPLPFLIKLIDFKVEFHPGTQVAKSYESMVEVIKGNASRNVKIFMNNPLREKDYTFYQASYFIDKEGRQYSTLAVVKNAGQMLPYIACFVVFFGLALHFILMALERRRR